MNEKKGKKGGGGGSLERMSVASLSRSLRRKTKTVSVVKKEKSKITQKQKEKEKKNKNKNKKKVEFEPEDAATTGIDGDSESVDMGLNFELLQLIEEEQERKEELEKDSDEDDERWERRRSRKVAISSIKESAADRDSSIVKRFARVWRGKELSASKDDDDDDDDAMSLSKIKRTRQKHCQAQADRIKQVLWTWEMENENTKNSNKTNKNNNKKNRKKSSILFRKIEGQEQQDDKTSFAALEEFYEFLSNSLTNQLMAQRKLGLELDLNFAVITFAGYLNECFISAIRQDDPFICELFSSLNSPFSFICNVLMQHGSILLSWLEEEERILASFTDSSSPDSEISIRLNLFFQGKLEEHNYNPFTHANCIQESEQDENDSWIGTNFESETVLFPVEPDDMAFIH